ncbi:fatty acid-binding protein 1, liver-like [Ptychodera flava]|uniref:fatty acid-binding protein 1, liver-like n=1 Tax=Ptychodera flava TaxID=63121 RepID=UPI003969F3BA
MSYEGKWKFEKSENMEKFLLAIGIAADKAKGVDAVESVVENCKMGDTFCIKTTVGSKVKEQKFKMGEPFELELPMIGVKDTVVASASANTLTIKSTTDMAVTETREVKGDTMIVTVSKPGVDVVAKRYLKRM